MNNPIPCNNCITLAICKSELIAALDRQYPYAMSDITALVQNCPYLKAFLYFDGHLKPDAKRHFIKFFGDKHAWK